ncbi:MAG: hypothetical protein K2Q14_07210 [Gammaproteobacteria bacterium]|nr:hypothetical protein [Gammaproteobacteria bacterium]
MKKLLIGLSCSTFVLLTGCNTLNNNYSALTPSGGNYNRNSVCENLRQQIEFNADRGYGTTNMGASQVQQQQLLASYQANGCDK